MDGTNYTLWEYPMRAYLEFKGYWLITIEGLPDLANRTTPFAYNPRVSRNKYYNLDDSAKGSIKQRLSNTIIEEIKDLLSTKEIWKHLEDKYNKAGSAQVFGDIQKVYAFQIIGNQNPEAEIAKLALLFACLKAQGVEMSKFYQAMTLLNAGSMKWPHLVSIYLSQNEMKELDFDKIKVMFVADWHRTTTLASAMVPHYTSTESTIDSRPSASPQKYQGTPTKSAWETVPEAISLLHRMDIKPSIQSVKTTEEPLLELTGDYPVEKTGSQRELPSLECLRRALG
ncbi:hypothetical protein AMATHDRAFT_8620 [Amanita thiersii Skay4041]|uniref:DUF4219 domain-containing protein n=1 Tax=Amanita thiersii Skay4041 TaxID=703135 RepID=A0A2A9NDU0_9AGAR|nr:hypothetical protein AMATHDRAFT_8620 [Amanita thiersii Skay4041]